MFKSRCNFFRIYSCEAFKLILLLCLATTLLCLLSIGSNTSYTTTSVSAILGSSSQLTTNNNFITYKDNSLGIKIDYPSGWIHELHAGGLLTFIPSQEGYTNTYPAGLGITVEHLKSKNLTLSEITKIQIKNLTQNHPDFRPQESTDFRLAGNIAHKIVFTATDSMKHERKAMQIWTVKGDKAYLITYKAEPMQYSKYLPTIQKMVESFQFTT
jgi:serine/threonine-protein kinase